MKILKGRKGRLREGRRRLRKGTKLRKRKMKRLKDGRKLKEGVRSYPHL